MKLLSLQPMKLPGTLGLISDYRIWIVGFRGKRVTSKLIKWYTRSKYNHIAIILDASGDLFEATFKDGVAYGKRNIKDIKEDYDIFEWPLVKADKVIVQEFLKRHLGKKYDWRMILQFVVKTQTKESRKSSESFYCSELASALGHNTSNPLFNDEDHWKKSPEDVCNSRMLFLKQEVRF